MLLATALADAYGAGFEFAPPDAQRPNDLQGFRPNTAYEALAPGFYTDDTQMALAIAEVLIAGTPTASAFADAFVVAYNRDCRPGYSRAFQAFLDAGVRDGADFQARIQPTSTKGGAAMRAGPIGLLPNPQDVVAVATLQARLTHDTPTGVASATAAALMVHHRAYALGPAADLPIFLTRYIPNVGWKSPFTGVPLSDGLDIVRAALGVVVANPSLTGAMIHAVAIGGDTDTVAAIAGAAIGADASANRRVPHILLDTLEDGAYGRTYLMGVEGQLARRFGLAHLAPSATATG